MLHVVATKFLLIKLFKVIATYEINLCCAIKYSYLSHGGLFGVNPLTLTSLEIPVLLHTFS